MTDSDFRDAFSAHKDVLYRFVYRMTGHPEGADDIVQECFLALWRKPSAYSAARGTLRAFLLGTRQSELSPTRARSTPLRSVGRGTQGGLTERLILAIAASYVAAPAALAAYRR